MKKILMITAALVIVASPSLAQSYNPKVGSGNLDSAPYANIRNQVQRNNTSPIGRRAVRQGTRYDASPAGSGVTNGSVNGYRWPGARYDEHGYYIDPNSPGRW